MKTLISIMLVLGLTAGNQWQFKTNTNQSKMTIFGTSSLHDWESEVGEFVVSGVATDQAITDLKVEVVTKSISSGKSIMDDKTYDALQANKFPKVLFTASKLNVDGTKISGQGQLTLAGVTKDIPIIAEALAPVAQGVTVKGKVEIDMTQYGIDPPTAMFGSLQTGEKVTIEYQLLLNK